MSVRQCEHHDVLAVDETEQDLAMLVLFFPLQFD